jgi:Tfp pilus assembly protein PilF
MNNFEIKEAKEAISLGLDIARRNNLPRRASDLALAAGDMYQAQNESKLAERCYQQALSFHSTIRVHNKFGIFHLKQKDFAQAADHFHRCPAVIERPVSDLSAHGFGQLQPLM